MLFLCFLSSALTSDTTDLHADSNGSGLTWTPGSNDTIGRNLYSEGIHLAEAGINLIRYYPNDKDKIITDSGTPADTIDNNFNKEKTHQVGIYYNYYTATAGTGTYSLIGEARSSLCPAQWQLSTNTSNKSRDNLIATYNIPTGNDNAVGSTKARLQIPISLHYTGRYSYDGPVKDQGSYGSWWSSTAYANTSARSTNVDSTRLIPQNGDSKAYSFSVRCVARSLCEKEIKNIKV